jgi:hypothetical protein
MSDLEEEAKNDLSLAFFPFSEGKYERANPLILL